MGEKSISKEAPNQNSWREYIVPVDQADTTIQDILTGPLAISNRMIQKLTRCKGIFINKKPAFLKRKVKAGDIIKVRIAFKEDANLEAIEIPLDIVFEDNQVMVINKASGISVHPIGKESGVTLAHGVAYHLEQKGLATKVRPVHRLDRDTSGLIIFAKSSMAHQTLDQQLRNNDLKRIYLAVIEGTLSPNKGTIDLPIDRDPKHPTKRIVTPKGDQAITNYRVLKEYKNAALVSLELETGRTHQIRVHLSHLGHPIIGDKLYGGNRRLGLKRQGLHASQINFQHPTTNEKIQLEGPLPKDIEELLEKLELSQEP
jgi:23S rRNA pseudouridine1911/1915/1917 synthase